jgi:hypothetical protein
VLAEMVAAFSTRGGQVASHGVEKKDPTFYYAPHVGGPWASEALNFGCQHCRSVISWVWGAEISRGSLAALSIGVVLTASALGGCKIRGVAMHCVATPPQVLFPQLILSASQHEPRLVQPASSHKGCIDPGAECVRERIAADVSEPYPAIFTRTVPTSAEARRADRQVKRLQADGA